MRRLLAIGVALCISAAAVADTTTGSAVRRFVFDGGFSASPGLRFQFGRDCTTVDRAGRLTPVDTPRFGAARALASGPAPVEMVRPTTWMTRLLGSGFDHDGQIPLMVLREYVTETLDVFSVGGAALLQAEATGVGRHRTALTGSWGNRADVLQGLVPGRAYNPEAGVVCHGLIVLLCAVSAETAPNVWIPVAQAVVVSADRGVTWALHAEDATVQPGAARVRSWSMQNWWPLTRGSAPLEAWFAASDYRYRGPGSADANGGRTILFRATRETVGGSWALGPIAPVIVSANGLGEHAHSAAVVPYGEAGLRVLTAFGDGFEYSRIASATRVDRQYASSGWSVNHAYHGSLETSGFQFVGCAPGPIAGEILLGADEGAQQIFRLIPDEDPQSRAHLEWLHGQGFQNGPGSRVFVIRTPSPENGGPYVASLSAGLEAHPRISERTLYSLDGVRWSEVFAPGGAHEPLIHDGHVYFDSLTGGPGVRRIALPAVRTLAPLTIGRGGANRLSASMAPPAGGDSMNALRLLSPEERAMLMPQPPTSGPVYEAGALPGGGWLVARWRPTAGTATLRYGAFTLRGWVMPIGAESVDMMLRLGHGAMWTPERAVHAKIAHDAWAPFTLRDALPGMVGSTYAPELLLTKAPGVQYRAYVALDALTEGTGFPGYALPAERTGSNEIALVSGIVASPTWTIAIAGEVPDDAWDASTGSPSAWTLASIRADAQNAIEIVADTAARRLVVRVTSAGSPAGSIEMPNVFFMRGSQVRVCIASAPGATHVTATVGMAPLASGSTSASMGALPREIRFSTADQTGVSSFVWFGGMVDPLSAYDQAQREQTLRELAFLEPITTLLGDANGDWRVDAMDLNAVLAAFGRSGPGLAGDVDGDGVVGFLDLNIVLSAFGETR